MRGLTLAEIRCVEALITEADANATAIAAVRELGDDAGVVQQLRGTAAWLRRIHDTGVLVSGDVAVSETVGLPDPPWPCGHGELTPGCDGCGNVVAAWWAEVRRRTAESHGQTVGEFYGE